MSFKLDEQTAVDLGIFQNPDGKSLFDMFNLCVSFGGKERFLKVMTEPSADTCLLKDRIDAISYFQSNAELVSTLDIDKNSLNSFRKGLKIKHLFFPLSGECALRFPAFAGQAPPHGAFGN